ncbi:MAG: hypothetical protein AB8H86_11695 [Polyangiales bacterium]
MRFAFLFVFLGGCSLLFPSDDFQGGDVGIDAGTDVGFDVGFDAGCVPSACPSGRCDEDECAPVCEGDSCVNVADVAATARLESSSYQLELVVGVPVQSEELESANYSLRLELETEF